MNRLLQVTDIGFDTVAGERYEAAFFATGYESRCISLSQRLGTSRIRSATAWGFEREALPALRKAHDLHFRQKWGVSPNILPHTDFSHAWGSVHHVWKGIRQRKGPTRILVDYSSMSRIWYAALINYFRLTSIEEEVIIDFSYTPGAYSSSYPNELQASVVTEIVAIPGLEGLSGTRESSIAVLGLGFTPAAALGVLERLQPQLIFGFYADPAARKEYTDICMASNQRLIHLSKFLLPLPLQSVSASYRRLCEAIIPFLSTQQITFIPMGPKPHVLASMLVGCKFRQVACMYAQLARRDVSDIEEGGEPSAVRVHFLPPDAIESADRLTALASM